MRKGGVPALARRWPAEQLYELLSGVGGCVVAFGAELGRELDELGTSRVEVGPYEHVGTREAAPNEGDGLRAPDVEPLPRRRRGAKCL